MNFCPELGFQVMGFPLGLKNIVLATASILTATKVSQLILGLRAA